MSLQTSIEHHSSYNNSQNIPYTIPHISRSRTTETNVTSSSTITQQDYNRESYRVPQYYSNPHSYSDRRRVRNKLNIHIVRIENILRRMTDNKRNQMDTYSLLSLDYDYGYVHIK